MRRVLVAVSILALIGGAFVIARALPSFSPRSITVGIDAVSVIPDPKSGLPTVQVSVNGRGPYRFIADTGAQATVITAELALELGLKQGLAVNAGRPGGGTMAGHVAHVERIEIGGTRLDDFDAVVLDLSSLWSGVDAPRGVLSIVTLPGVLVALDGPARTLVVSAGALPEPDGRATFAWADGSALPTATVELAGHEIVVTLDTGSNFDLTLPNDYANELPLVGPPTVGAGDRGVDGTLTTRSAILAGTGHLGTHGISRPAISFADVPRAKVGSGILTLVTLVIDATNRRVRIAP